MHTTVWWPATSPIATTSTSRVSVEAISINSTDSWMAAPSLESAVSMATRCWNSFDRLGMSRNSIGQLRISFMIPPEDDNLTH
jgi:hypothetical protein